MVAGTGVEKSSFRRMPAPIRNAIRSFGFSVIAAVPWFVIE